MAKLKKIDLLVVKYLLFIMLTIAFVGLFWLIFDATRAYQEITATVEDYLTRSLLHHKNIELIFDETLDRLLNQRMEAIRSLLIYLIYLIVIIFGFIVMLANIDLLVIAFNLIIVSALLLNLFIEILSPYFTVIMAVVILTIGCLHVYLMRIK